MIDSPYVMDSIPISACEIKRGQSEVETSCVSAYLHFDSRRQVFMADDNSKTINVPRTFTVKSAVRFLGMSALGFVLNPGITALLHEVGQVPVNIAYAVALCTVFVVNFLLLRYIIYGKTTGSPHGQLAGFAASTLAFRIGEYILFLTLSAFIKVHYIVLIIGISVVFTVLKYLFYGSTIFRPAEK
jgi:putative flippase GtrA